jgi:hypothetical protein
MQSPQQSTAMKDAAKSEFVKSTSPWALSMLRAPTGVPRNNLPVGELVQALH